MIKLITRILGTETVEAGEACDIVKEHRCKGGRYQERVVQYYGRYCQYKKVIRDWYNLPHQFC